MIDTRVSTKHVPMGFDTCVHVTKPGGEKKGHTAMFLNKLEQLSVIEPLL